jgi:glutamate-1-semialdehyde 2,1-aminomutase
MAKNLKNSLEFLKRAKKVLPAQTHTFSKGYKSFVEGVYPVFAESAKGSHIFDIDGNEYIDYMAALGPIILGYSYEPVVDAIKKQLEKGSIFTLPHRMEVEAAELMCNTVPGCDMAKFTKTGSDSVTAAVRASRAITGKDNVAYWGGGGVWHDWFTVITSRNRGVPKSLKKMIKLFQYNNIDSLKSLLDDDKEIGTVCMEPMTFEFPSNNFLNEVKRVAHDHDALLVFDEVQTGFRWALGGAQEYFGITADLSAWGKAMANGMPLGAISGKSEFMSVFDEVFYSTTFAGETLSLAAFSATVEELKEKKALSHIHQMGQKFKEEFEKLTNDIDVTVPIDGFPAKLRLTFPDANGNDSLINRSLFCQENIENGVFYWQGPIFHMYSHTDDDLTKTLVSTQKSLQILKNAMENNTVEKSLRGKPMNRVLTFPV